MLAAGEPSHIVNTSSGDGAINPLAGASVYAASKTAVAILTECLATQLATENARPASRTALSSDLTRTSPQ
jgi:NAD(P)-dependent dehydrogenase (short-subunit alcohol dehydrogenase family)